VRDGAFVGGDDVQMTLECRSNMRDGRFASIRGQRGDLNNHVRLRTFQELMDGIRWRAEWKLKAQAFRIVGGSVPPGVRADNPERIDPALGKKKAGKGLAHVAITDKYDPQLLRVATAVAYFFLDTFAHLRQTEGSLGCCAGDGVRLALGDLVKIRALVLTLVCAASAFGQLQQEAPVERSSGGFNPVTLASEFFDRGNFVNYYAFANAVYDSFSPTLNSSGQSVNNGGFGYDLGGGISASHAWSKSTLALSYSGSYRNYSNTFFANGTNQNLSLSFSRRLARRWSFNTGVLAGTALYGTGYFGAQAATNGNVQLNPFSPNTRYASGYVSVAYQQSRRLSYVFTGGIYLQRYSYPGAIGTTGGNGAVAVVYRVTARTTVSGDYNHSYFAYQLDAGNTNLDGFNFSVSHRFANRWGVTASGGVTHTNVAGLLNIPVGAITSTGAVSGFIRVPYNTSALSPAFAGSVSRYMRRSQFSASGGQNIISGNGYYLASRNQFINGVYSRSYRRLNASFGGYWSRLNTLTSSVGYSYSTSGFSANYGYVVMRHVSANARYDFVRYGTINLYPSVSDNRFSFGVSFSSKSIPLTLY